MKRSSVRARPTLSRRKFVGLCLALPAALALAACTSDNGPTGQLATTPQASASGGPVSASPAAAAATCVMYPEETEGPYYIDLNKLRQDITEGKPGTPLRLLLNVVQLPACAPVANAAV